MGQNHKRHYETAPTWMIERLQHQVATNDLIAYGNAELLLAAESGAVEALLIGEHETCDETIVPGHLNSRDKKALHDGFGDTVEESKRSRCLLG